MCYSPVRVMIHEVNNLVHRQRFVELDTQAFCAHNLSFHRQSANQKPRQRILLAQLGVLEVPRRLLVVPLPCFRPHIDHVVVPNVVTIAGG